MLQPAVFFDRDGVLNVDIGYLHKQEDFQWVQGAKEAIRFLKDQGFLVFVVTNQSGVARGYYKEVDVHQLHQWIQKELQEVGAQINAFYYCPHHPEGTISNYKLKCNCRKPEPGLIQQALEEWPVDKTSSFLVGDNVSDVAAAEAAGIRGYQFRGGDLFAFVKSLMS